MSTLASEPRAADASRGYAPPVLQVVNLAAYYGELRAIYDVSFELQRGDVLAIIGANGAGKSTLLRSLVGLMAHGSTTRTRGSIEFNGQRLDRLRPERIVEAGVAMVPEGRRLFARMSVEDNLLAGAYLPRCRARIPARLEEVYTLFPRLRERRQQLVSQMSGGEQQMVAIGRALMSSPQLLIFDELSLGLSPTMVDEIYRNFARIVASGATTIVVEQDLKRALAACTRFIVMLEGSIALEGRPGEVSEDEITAAYFGVAGNGGGHGGGAHG